MKPEELRQELASLSCEVNTDVKDEVALFIQKEYPIKAGFMNQVARLCNANVKGLDFKKSDKEPEIVVNKQLFFTRGKNGGNIDFRVDMMFGRAPIPYYEDEQVGYRAIILPYKNNSMHMYVILPGKNKTLKNLTESLKHKDFANIAEKSAISEVFYAIPKMHLENTYSVKSAIQSRTVRTLFDPVSANLSKITDKQIHVSEILQKVVIDVNEKAGDTTTNIGTTTSHINNDKYIYFTVNRPFAFFIFDAKAKVMTLWASIYKPTGYK
ncbi:serpin B11-like [Planococcus citri]|uniref:serpin B11-like n=1 Tax=Planococcus citri TaxID=170843 RepID=UPI0031F7DDBA